MDKVFFPPRPDAAPKIYAYEEYAPGFEGMLKVGYTIRPVGERMKEHFPTKGPDGVDPYKVVFTESAMYSDGGNFLDHAVHRALEKRGIHKEGGEWFKCTVDQLTAAYIAVRDKVENVEDRSRDFSMRPEQLEAVQMTSGYFERAEKEKWEYAPKFLWNAKMRFGKTFAAYQLAKKMQMSKVLILTFKPAVQSAWEEDLLTHVDFEGWQFISKTSSLSWDDADKSRPIVCFGSFQDYLGTNASGGIKSQNEWVHTTNWDMVIFDEYHFGAWRDSAQKLFAKENEDDFEAIDIEKYAREEEGNAFNESFLPITSERYLYLSGTPFRALNSGEFIEDQVYSWTYSDEQRAKQDWVEPPNNPYATLPRIVMMTYKIPESIERIAKQGEFDEFDLNVFFAAEGTGANAKFKNEEYVQKWIDLIRGAHLGTTTDDLKLGAKKPDMPFSNKRLLSLLSHTLWFLPTVASCYAMCNLLKERQNSFFHDFEINVCASSKAGVGVGALPPVLRSMRDPLKSRTITLSCGKLTTGVTVKPWIGIFMLRNLSSPESYFQAAFRVQSPWVVDGEYGMQEIVKRECYIFDFALNRALRQIAEYSNRLDVGLDSPEKKVAEFIKFLPVIAYDGSTLRQIEASDILDITMAGTSATLLARRWESALLVNVDNATLARLMASEAAMEALMSIEGFRSLNNDIETIINLSEKVKEIKASGGKLSKKEKKNLTDEEKEFKSKRKQIQEKLIKFATRIPIFMYLTDFREESLKDVITQLEPGLFKKVTGLGVKDFELLVSLGLFNDAMMNDAVWNFRRYEDTSLSYTGLDKHEGEGVGGFDTVLTRKEYEDLYGAQQATLLQGVTKAEAIEGDSKPVRQAFTRVSSAKAKKVKGGLKSNRAQGASQHDSLPPLSPLKSRQISTRPDQRRTDLSKVAKGSVVEHKMFGTGVVLDLDSGTVIVAFADIEKRFGYPYAFNEGILSVED